MDEIKIIDVTTAKTKLQDFIARTELRLSIIKDVLEFLKQFEGKDITKRIETALNKQFPEYSFTISSPYGWYALDISDKTRWMGHNPVPARFDSANINLKYLSAGKQYEHEHALKGANPYLLDEERLVGYRKKLETIEDDCKRYNNALLEFSAAQKNLDDVKFVVTKNNTVYIRDTKGFSIN